MEQVYYAIAAVVYGVFIVRFFISLIGGGFDADADLDVDTDTDADVDTDSGPSLSDIISFKGVTHFLMGSSGWLSIKSYTTHNVQWYDFIIAFVIGLIFLIILYFIYKFLTKLESKPKILSGTELVGARATIYLNMGRIGNYFEYSITVNNGVGTVELSAKSKKEYHIGNSVIINSYEDGYYLI